MNKLQCQKIMMYNMKMRTLTLFVIVLILLHSFACSKMQVDYDPRKTYKMEIEISNLDRSAIGMMWLGRKELYTINMEADEKIDILSFRTCSREVILTDPKSIFNKKKFVYNYRPNEIESGPSCPIKISALNEKGLYAMGYIDLIDETTTLPAHNVCGTITENTYGVSTCQERKGSFESISFDVEVRTNPDKGCELESGNKGKEFKYSIKEGECQYVFIEVEKPHRMARLTTFGYSDILFRK